MAPPLLPPDRLSDATRRLKEAETLIARMEHSLSWRLTKPLRMLGAFVRGQKNPSPALPEATVGPVAVVIPCHNYGRHLAQAIDSLFTQDMRPAEIVVVDDSSTDETPEVARRYAEKGVRYLRGEWKDVAKARNAGAALTVQPLIMFLDADDWLPQHYIARCAAAMQDPQVGIAYGAMQHFEELDYLYPSEEFNYVTLQMGNYISSHALLRRSAFDVVGGYRTSDAAHHDWDIYCRITQAGWTGKKADTFVNYRMHSGSMLQQHKRDPARSYWREGYLMENPLTVFTVFTGKRDLLEQYMNALRACDFNHALIRLHCLDISGDAAFGSALRSALADLPFGSVTHARKTTDGRTGNALEAFTMSHLRNACDTEYALLLAEDLLPAPETLRKLLQTFTSKTAAVVAHYPLPDGKSSVWKKDAGVITHADTRGTGTEEVGGGGLGCTMLHMSVLREVPLIAGTAEFPQATLEESIFLHMRSRGNILCNWDTGVIRS